MSRKFKFRNPEVLNLSKCALYLFLTFNLITLQTFNLSAQGVTKYGESKSTSTDFVDKNGKIGNSPALSKYGQVLVLATLTTTAASSINSTTATSGGNVTSDGGTTITARGVCWATTSTPTTAGSKTTDAGTTGIFISSITALTAGTIYYVRAYATNSAGTAYGSELSFTTLAVPGAPIIGTAVAGNTQASVPFTAPASNGGSTITSYTATSSPDGFTGTLSQEGSGTITVSDLTNGTDYTFTVKAINAIGTSVASSASNSITPSVIPQVTNPKTGKSWMDRNLGATQVATSSTDAAAYGDLYQWGRGTDGHQIRTSTTTSTLSSTDAPGHGYFITSGSSPYDWRSPKNDNLWQGVSGINNPCPSGFRLPTYVELDAERASWSTQNSAGAYASPLKFAVAGYRNFSSGSLSQVGSYGRYWSSTVDGTNSLNLDLYSGANSNSTYRACGFSVRCIKD